MRDLGDGLEIRHVVARVPNALHVDGLGLVINQGSNLLWVVAIDKLGLDAQSRQKDLELVVSATVQVRSGDDVVASMCKGINRNKLGALARRSSKSSYAAFEGCNSLLKYVDSGL